jgi:hypothetical protein
VSRRVFVVLAALVAVGMVTTLFVGGAVGAPTRLRATLTGEAEVPGPGDDNGSGRARIRLIGEKRKVCFKLSWRRIGPVLAAHIHAAPRGEAGDIVVPLFEAGKAGLSTTVKRVSGCVRDVARAVIRGIKRHPRRYYVNVHTTGYPDGAIRGQLRG